MHGCSLRGFSGCPTDDWFYAKHSQATHYPLKFCSIDVDQQPYAWLRSAMTDNRVSDYSKAMISSAVLDTITALVGPIITLLRGDGLSHAGAGPAAEGFAKAMVHLAGAPEGSADCTPLPLTNDDAGRLLDWVLDQPSVLGGKDTVDGELCRTHVNGSLLLWKTVCHCP